MSNTKTTKNEFDPRIKSQTSFQSMILKTKNSTYPNGQALSSGGEERTSPLGPSE